MRRQWKTLRDGHGRTDQGGRSLSVPGAGRDLMTFILVISIIRPSFRPSYSVSLLFEIT